MTECPSGCGACCSPVTTPFSRHEALIARPPAIDAEDRRFILEDLTPISRREGLTRAGYLSQGGKTTWIIQGVPTIVFTQFFVCRWFDETERRCTNYENRPPMCSGYPWYGEPPDRSKNIPVCCAFRADRGEIPEPVPVTIGRKP